MNSEIQKNLRFNFIVNLLDGGFFGFAMGFTSFVTIIPLFVNTFTSSAILIGLIPAIHSMGWQLPQLLIANRVSRLKRYKWMVLWMTIHERIPFIGLGIIAWYSPVLGGKASLVLIFLMLIWQGVGGGLAATPWISLIGKIIPIKIRGTFFGAQGATANVLASVSAVLAGMILQRFSSPGDYTICFLLTGIGMTLSWIALALTREPEFISNHEHQTERVFWSNLRIILQKDSDFRRFLLVRMMTQFTVMSFAFYTVYAVRKHGMSVAIAGVMTAILMATQIVASPILGWMGDRFGHRPILEIGAFTAIASALIAWYAPSVGWFYLVFPLVGITNVTTWTIPLAMVLEFGSEVERPAYIGLANTLIAPATFIAPLLGGWLADSAGYPATFIASAVLGMITAALLHWYVRDPRLREKES